VCERDTGSGGRKPLHTGGCQCGAVRFAIYAEPTRAGICHCRMCQKATGNPFHAFTGVPKTDFSWLRGAPGKFKSSDDGERSFCRDCGTPLTFDYLPGQRITVGIATLDQPENIRPPERSIGTESKLTWIDGIAALPAKSTEENSGSADVNGVKNNQFGGDT